MLGLCDDAERQHQDAGERPQVLDVFWSVDRLELGLDAGRQWKRGQPLGPEQVADLFRQGEQRIERLVLLMDRLLLDRHVDGNALLGLGS